MSISFEGGSVGDRRYNRSEMAILRGHAEGGRVVIDEEGELPEGAELLASIDRGLEQAARGETIPAEEVLRRLRSLG